MRLFESIIEVNLRRVAGDKSAVVPAAGFASELPLAALTCIDPRLNRLLPDQLGLPEDQFIWLRNAGNIITGPLTSTMRSLALACAIKGAKEIVIIGHSDCHVGRMTMLQLLNQFKTLGVDRARLPENLVEYFGLFGSERQNVIHGVEFVRSSPLIGSQIPVHGLLIDVNSGRLEWVVNGYQQLDPATSGRAGDIVKKSDQSLNAFAKIGQTVAEDLKVPSAKIGEVLRTTEELLRKAGQITGIVEEKLELPGALKSAAPVPPPRIPLPQRSR
jgi:carbonic anhydrase